MADFYLGQVILFAGNFAPRGWAFCDGSLLQISTNEALYSLLGTTYGGDGANTFGLPDLRGAVPVSAGQAPGRSSYALGQGGGTEAVTLTPAQLPSHTHAVTAATAPINVSNATADQTSPKGAVFAQPATTSMYQANKDASTTLSPRAVTTTVTVATAGASAPVSVMMPYVAINYCICTEGIYPSRN